MARILYFTRNYTPHDHRFLTALARTEHKITYLQLERGEQTLEERPLPAGIESISWAGGRGTVNFDDFPDLLTSLQDVIRRVKPNLIHAGPIQRSAYLVALAGFHPLVSMSWGYDLIHDASLNRDWEGATRFTLGHSSVMIADCDTIRELAISYGMTNDRIVTFPWGIDLDQFTPDYSAPISDRRTFTLLSTRGWESIYGVDVIARAFVKAASARPEVRLVMLGSGSQIDLLRQIFEDGGVAEKVHFPGQISQSELPKLYRSADLYISASHSDGTSISLLEALASGRPAIVSAIPGNREWIIPGVQGWLFPDGDHEALAQAILGALDQRDRLIEMGREARTLAEARADWSVNFQHLLHAYQLALHPIKKHH